MIDSALAKSGTQPVDPVREAQAARAVLPHVHPGMAVLDLCCGAGWSTLLLAARLGNSAPGARVLAWDPDDQALRAAAEHIRRANSDHKVQLVDAVPIGEGFDLVYCSHRAWARDRSAEPMFAMLLACATRSLRTDGQVAVTLPPEHLSAGLQAIHCAGLVPMHPVSREPLLAASDLELTQADSLVMCQPVRDRIGMLVHTHVEQRELLRAFALSNPGVLLENDLDSIDNDCERYARKRRDAEVLCGLAASHPGPCLDLGTSHGRSAFKLATNIGQHVVTTVNMLPEQAIAAGVHTTHVLSAEDIGRYPRSRGIRNMQQIYANTLDWDWLEVPDGLHLAFIDACHDTEAVLSDSLHAWRKLAPGGFLVWHDFSPALAKVHPWIETCVAGVAAFVAQAKPAKEVHHLLGSWCGVLQK